MNQKIVNVPQHIDPRELVVRDTTTETLELAALMKQSGNTPYRYIRRAMKCLAEGRYSDSYNWLSRAEEFMEIFYTPGSDDSEAYNLTVGTLRLQFLFLTEKFKEIDQFMEE